MDVLFFIRNHEVLTTEREPEGPAQRSNLGTAFGLHKISRFFKPTSHIREIRG